MINTLGTWSIVPHHLFISCIDHVRVFLLLKVRAPLRAVVIEIGENTCKKTKNKRKLIKSTSLKNCPNYYFNRFTMDIFRCFYNASHVSARWQGPPRSKWICGKQVLNIVIRLHLQYSLLLPCKSIMANSLNCEWQNSNTKDTLNLQIYRGDTSFWLGL